MNIESERAAFEAWYETTYGISLEPEFRANHFIGYVNDKANHRWTAWQARAALSAPSHGERVRNGYALELLRRIVAGDVGQQMLSKLRNGQATETDDGRNWLEAKAMLAASPSAGSQEQGE